MHTIFEDEVVRLGCRAELGEVINGVGVYLHTVRGARRRAGGVKGSERKARAVGAAWFADERRAE